MKTIYLLSVALTLSAANAQVPNNGFEQTLEDGFTLKNWGTYFPVSETSPENTIFFDNGNGFSMPVGDCLTGSWAIQISNAFDMQSNSVLPGKVSLFNDAEFPMANGSNHGIPLADDALVQFLGFDYKFFPMGDDIAVAKLELFNANGQSVGKSEITIMETTTDFQYVYMPVNFTSGDTPTSMTIDFSMQKNDSEVNSWSTLIVDNVVVNSMMLGVGQNPEKLFSVYPTLTDRAINIIAADITGNVTVSIINSEGKKLHQQSLSFENQEHTIDVSHLARGAYFLSAESDSGKWVTRFLKQ